MRQLHWTGFAGFLLLLLAMIPTRAQPVARIINYASIADFDTIPGATISTAAALDMMFVNRSVGGNVTDGLTCMQSTYASAANSCKRTAHLPEYPEFNNSVESWTGSYSRLNWDFFGWPGVGIPPEITCDDGTGDVFTTYRNCFTDFVNTNQANFTVFSMIPSYIDGASGGCLTSSDATNYLNMMASLKTTYPSETFLFWTSSLARPSTGDCSDFNGAIRTYVTANGGILIDIASIESHTQAGVPCYDSRDGVEYIGPNGSENYADDSVNTEAICQNYTRETDGGHMGNPDVGKIRVAKGFWLAMAYAAGWDQTTPPAVPSLLRLRLKV